MSEIKISAGFEREKIWKRGDSVRYLVVDIETLEQEARSNNSSVNIALEEAHYGIKQIFDGEQKVELNAQNSFIRRRQHKAAAKE